jgi:NTE family protein
MSSDPTGSQPGGPVQGGGAAAGWRFCFDKPAQFHYQTRSMHRALRSLAAAGMVLLAGGCAHAPVNVPLGQRDAAHGYSFHAHQRPNNLEDLLLVLTFSGGGTRAAALACGVLEELGRTRFAVAGAPRRLLDEVDVISSVSGGSVTAAAYGLYGERAFTNLAASFLKRDVQGALLSRTLNPLNWCRLGSGTFGRSDLAAEYYDKILFRGATFGDLDRQPGPFLIINATDVSTGARFDFTQSQFDLIGSDLRSYRVSRAVAASSAVPAVLTPVTLRNYGGDRGVPPDWLADVARQTNRLSERVLLHVAEVRGYLDSLNRPYLHLVDGGVADNLGLRVVLDALSLLEVVPALAPRYRLDRVTKVAVICVNAHSAPEKDWDRKPSPPGMVNLAVASAIIPIDRYSAETLALLKEKAEHWRQLTSQSRRRAAAGPEAPLSAVQFYPVVVGFAGLADRQERHYFMEQPTSFRLPATAVDRLREVGGRLLRQSPEYQQLLRDLGVGAGR